MVAKKTVLQEYIKRKEVIDERNYVDRFIRGNLVSVAGLYPAQTWYLNLNERRLSGDRKKRQC
jgi:hypothetical protein